jgi:hypothetical protein
MKIELGFSLCFPGPKNPGAKAQIFVGPLWPD